ncbi:hypothetical protein [Pseudorhodoferax sp.]|uniref:hypothetical protein n=1 Tax=Pseudorhodoferax sp. TaxID=1993553 RepID=UPI0039E30B5E
MIENAVDHQEMHEELFGGNSFAGGQDRLRFLAVKVTTIAMRNSIGMNVMPDTNKMMDMLASSSG